MTFLAAIRARLPWAQERIESTYDFSNVPDAWVEDMVEQADRLIDGTIQIGIAADQKATSLMSAVGTLAAALAAAAATLMVAADAGKFHSLIVACWVGAAFLTAAVFCFTRAVKAADFHVAGHEPHLQSLSVGSRHQMLRHLAASLQRRIDANRLALDRTATWTNRGISTSWIAAIAAAIGYLVS